MSGNADNQCLDSKRPLGMNAVPTMVEALGTMDLPSAFDTHDTLIIGMEIWVDIYIFMVF